MESKLNIFVIPAFLFDNFDCIKQACDFKISPSFKTLKLFAFSVAPVEVISEIISAVPVKGLTSVLPRL